MNGPTGAQALPPILLVDDSPETLELTAMTLEADGFRSVGVPSAQDALEYLKTHPTPLCMFVDFDMPGMNGLDLVKEVRRQFGDDIVLIAITGSFGLVDDASLEEFFERVDHHYEKPVDWDRLFRLLSALR